MRRECRWDDELCHSVWTAQRTRRVWYVLPPPSPRSYKTNKSHPLNLFSSTLQRARPRLILFCVAGAINAEHAPPRAQAQTSTCRTALRAPTAISRSVCRILGCWCRIVRLWAVRRCVLIRFIRMRCRRRVGDCWLMMFDNNVMFIFMRGDVSVRLRCGCLRSERGRGKIVWLAHRVRSQGWERSL